MTVRSDPASESYVLVRHPSLTDPLHGSALRWSTVVASHCWEEQMATAHRPLTVLSKENTANLMQVRGVLISM